MLLAWQKAIETFDSSKAIFTYEGSPIDMGYVLPEPTIFVQAQSIDRNNMYFKSWLKYRDAFIYHATSGTDMSRPIPTQVWHDILTHEQGQKPASSTHSTTTRSQQQWDQALMVFEVCIKAERVQFLGLHNGCMTWAGKAVEMVMDGM